MSLVSLEQERLVEAISSAGEAGDWKLLVYDSRGRSILAPLLRVGRLRSLGVTLWLDLEETRSQVLGVQVVYFVEHSEATVQRIANDLAQGLYTSCTLLFIDRVEEAEVAAMAKVMVEAGVSHAVRGIRCLHTRFVALEKDLFTLQIPDSFVSFNDSHISEKDASLFLERVVEGLFGVFLTQASVPILRCPPDSPVAQAVCRELTKRIRSSLERGEWPSSVARGHRSVAIILDRNLDFTGMLHHSWTYQALMQDILGLKDNKVMVMVDDSEATGPTKITCDLDSAQDPMWCELRSLAWPDIGPKVKGAYDAYKADLGGLRNLEVSENDASDALVNKAQGLGDAVSRLGAMTERKRVLDLHTNASHQVSRALQDRGFAEFFRLERELLQERKVDARDVQVAVGAGQPGTRTDKLRLALIWLLTGERESDSVTSVERALSASGCDMEAFKLVKQRGQRSSDLPSVERTSSIVTRGWKTLVTTSGSVKELMKRYGHGDTECLKLTAVVEEIMQNKQGGTEVDGYLYFDPRASSSSSTPPRQKAEFTQGMVFVIGGGNYFEYSNVAGRFDKERTVVYGATDIMSPEQFCKQLGALAGLEKTKE